MSKIPRLYQAILIIIGCYLAFKGIFDWGLHQPVPQSLLGMYMIFIIIGVGMVYTFRTDDGATLLAPLQALVDDPRQRLWRNAVIALVPVLVGFGVFQAFKDDLQIPTELRTVHPAPPGDFMAFGRKIVLKDLHNPLRTLEKQDPEAFAEQVAEGGFLYAANCAFCHGAHLDGRGPYAAALSPQPINFQDIGTIAQLQESYVFWRIATGGAGLPKEAAPWASAMPAWAETLSEDQIWQLVLFLYDYTGQRPRSFEVGS